MSKHKPESAQRNVANTAELPESMHQLLRQIRDESKRAADLLQWMKEKIERANALGK